MWRHAAPSWRVWQTAVGINWRPVMRTENSKQADRGAPGGTDSCTGFWRKRAPPRGNSTRGKTAHRLSSRLPLHMGRGELMLVRLRDNVAGIRLGLDDRWPTQWVA